MTVLKALAFLVAYMVAVTAAAWFIARPVYAFGGHDQLAMALTAGLTSLIAVVVASHRSHD